MHDPPVREIPGVAGTTRIIRPLEKADLPQAQRILRVAFGTFLAVFAAQDDGAAVLGSSFATSWGSVGVFGPLHCVADNISSPLAWSNLPESAGGLIVSFRPS